MGAKKFAFLCVHESLFCTSYRKTCIQFKVRLIKVNKDFFSKKKERTRLVPVPGLGIFREITNPEKNLRYACLLCSCDVTGIPALETNLWRLVKTGRPGFRCVIRKQKGEL